jgi:hypothetical protein
MRGRVVGTVVVLGAVLLLAACAPGGDDVANTVVHGGDPAGFWHGLWQGFISPFTFVISLFTDSVGIYEVHNNGAWYDFGFMIGVSAVFGGGGSSSARRRSRTAD